MTLIETANYLCISPHMTRYYYTSNVIPGKKIGNIVHFHKEELKKFQRKKLYFHDRNSYYQIIKMKELKND